MKKFLIGLLAVVAIIPWLFLLTDVSEIPKSGSEYRCTVKRFQYEKHFAGLGSVYYDTFFMANKHVILPWFFIEGNMMYLECNGQEVLVGRFDQDNSYYPGAKVTMYSRTEVISLAKHELSREESIFMFGTGWRDEEKK